MSASAEILTSFDQFERNPMQFAAKLRRLLQEDAREFLEAVSQTGDPSSNNRGLRHALTLLRSSGVLIPYLVDPRQSSFEQALRLMRSILAVDPEFTDILLSLMASGDPALVPIECKLRSLDLTADTDGAVTNWRHILELAQCEDQRLRSRSLRLIARRRKDAESVESIFEKSDARSRADLLEALANEEHPGIENIVLRAVSDGNNRVAANACLAAYRAGDHRALVWISQMFSGDQEVSFRISAAWAMAQSKDSRFAPGLISATRSGDGAGVPKLRAAALKALTSLERPDCLPLDPDIRLACAFETPCWVEADQQAERMLCITGVPEPFRSIDILIYQAGTPVLAYEAAKAQGGQPCLRVASNAAALAELSGPLLADSGIRLDHIAVYGQSEAERANAESPCADTPCLRVSSIGDAAQAIRKDWEYEGRKVLLIVLDQEVPFDLDLRSFQSECAAAGIELHMLEYEHGGQPIHAKIDRFGASGGAEIWARYSQGIREGIYVRFRAKQQDLSLRMRRKADGKIYFSEKLICP